MFSLVTERGKYLRIRGEVKESEVISALGCPFSGDLFQGAVIKILPPKRCVYATVGDTYAKIAARERVDEAQLKSLNGDKTLYPTMRVWLP